jgi:hypothetical protein
MMAFVTWGYLSAVMGTYVACMTANSLRKLLTSGMYTPGIGEGIVLPKYDSKTYAAIVDIKDASKGVKSDVKKLALSQSSFDRRDKLLKASLSCDDVDADDRNEVRRASVKLCAAKLMTYLPGVSDVIERQVAWKDAIGVNEWMQAMQRNDADTHDVPAVVSPTSDVDALSYLSFFVNQVSQKTSDASLRRAIQLNFALPDLDVQNNRNERNVLVVDLRMRRQNKDAKKRDDEFKQSGGGKKKSTANKKKNNNENKSARSLNEWIARHQPEFARSQEWPRFVMVRVDRKSNMSLPIATEINDQFGNAFRLSALITTRSASAATYAPADMVANRLEHSTLYVRNPSTDTFETFQFQASDDKATLRLGSPVTSQTFADDDLKYRTIGMVYSNAAVDL